MAESARKGNGSLTAIDAAQIINISPETNKELLRNGDEVIRFIKDWVTDNDIREKHDHHTQRRFKHRSAMGSPDKSLFDNAATAEEFWKRVADLIGVKDFINVEGMMDELARIPPGQTATSTALYREVRRQLSDIAALGRSSNWASTEGMADMVFPTEEILEAMRVYGDEKDGLGTMPQPIVRLLGETGLAWMCASDDKRNIPTYWMAFLVRLQKQEQKQATAYEGLEGVLGRMTLPPQSLSILNKLVRQGRGWNRSEKNPNLVFNESFASERTSEKSWEGTASPDYTDSSDTDSDDTNSDDTDSDDEDISARLPQGGALPRSNSLPQEHLAPHVIPQGNTLPQGNELPRSNAVPTPKTNIAREFSTEEHASKAHEDAVAAPDLAQESDFSSPRQPEDQDEAPGESLEDLVTAYMREDSVELGIGVENAIQWVGKMIPGLTKTLGSIVGIKGNEHQSPAEMAHSLDTRWNYTIKTVVFGLVPEVIHMLTSLAKWVRQELSHQDEKSEALQKSIVGVEECLNKDTIAQKETNEALHERIDTMAEVIGSIEERLDKIIEANNTKNAENEALKARIEDLEKRWNKSTRKTDLQAPDKTSFATPVKMVPSKPFLPFRGSSYGVEDVLSETDMAASVRSEPTISGNTINPFKPRQTEPSKKRRFDI